MRRWWMSFFKSQPKSVHHGNKSPADFLDEISRLKGLLEKMTREASLLHSQRDDLYDFAQKWIPDDAWTPELRKMGSWGGPL